MLPLTIAVRFLRSGAGQTALITAGMAVAVSIQVFVGLLIGSLQQSLVDRTVRNSPQITITSATEVATLRDWSRLEQDIRATGLAKAISPTASGSAVTRTLDNEYPLLLRGLHIDEADPIYKIKSNTYAGTPYPGAREVLIGRELAAELKAGVGDKLTILTPNSLETVFTIVGLYDLGTAAINKSWVITHMRTVQQLYGYASRITSLDISVADVFAADSISWVISRELNNPDLKIDNWKDQNQQLLGALRSQGMSSAIIQVVIIASVVIAIASVLAISVLQKSRQLGILKAMGIRDLDASLIFIWQGFLLGIVGSALGVAMGLGLLYAFNYFARDSGGVPTIPIYLDYGFLVISWLIALAASTLAGFVPARRSLRLNPIDVIREG
jgi:lipoprotein-releasing system permease protein